MAYLSVWLHLPSFAIAVFAIAVFASIDGAPSLLQRPRNDVSAHIVLMTNALKPNSLQFLVHNNNCTPSFTASCTVKVLIATRACPLLGAPCITSRLIDTDGFLAFAFCALHESDCQLMSTRFPCSGSPTKRLSNNPFGQLHATPAEDPALQIASQLHRQHEDIKSHAPL